MKTRVDVDFIWHLRIVLPAMFVDPRIKGVDVFMYMSLFVKWNKEFFNNPFNIKHEEIKGIGKISNDNYSTSLRRLHMAGYIVYKKGKNGIKFAIVAMVRFDHDKKHFQTQLIAVPNTEVYNPKFPMASIPEFEIIEKHKNDKQKINNSSISINVKPKLKMDEPAVQVSGNCILNLAPPYALVEKYFISNSSSVAAAKKFYEFNNARNWSIQSTTDEWLKYANTWINNSKKFKKTNKRTPHDYNTGTDQEYNEPL